MSIKRKLTLIMMATSGTAIFLMAFFIVVNQAVNSQKAISQQLTTLADVLGSTSTGAITFDDSAAGTEILSALRFKPNIIHAVIEREDGQIFVQYGRDLQFHQTKNIDTFYAKSDSKRYLADLFTNEIHVSRDIYLDNAKIGNIHIVSSLDKLQDDLKNFMSVVAFISLLCLFIAFMVCNRLQRIISTPIVKLHEAMDSVSNNKDYSIRVESIEENEFGTLAEGFNHMLGQIQFRDNELAKYRSSLERTVTERTMQLTDANKKRLFWLESMARFLRHELKNSSVGIKTSLDLIERRAIDKQKIDLYLARARKSLSNMNALLKSAGDASDLEAVIYKEKLKSLNLTRVLITHMEMYSSIYPEVSIVANFQDEIFIRGNENRLTQLLDKLITNAVEHCNHLQPIEVSVKKHRDMARLIVKNHGEALPKDKNTIFDLFVSLRPVERKTDENFGLGLYVVKLIAESHGGYVHAYDLKGESGAVFVVSFPLTT